MIVDMSLISVMGAVATILSLVGAYYVASTSSHEQERGYTMWFISNVFWVIYFINSKQVWPLILYVIYLVITVKALYVRLPQERKAEE